MCAFAAKVGRKTGEFRERRNKVTGDSPGRVRNKICRNGVWICKHEPRIAQEERLPRIATRKRLYLEILRKLLVVCSLFLSKTNFLFFLQFSPTWNFNSKNKLWHTNTRMVQANVACVWSLGGVTSLEISNCISPSSQFIYFTCSCSQPKIEFIACFACPTNKFTWAQSLWAKMAEVITIYRFGEMRLLPAVVRLVELLREIIKQKL